MKGAGGLPLLGPSSAPSYRHHRGDHITLFTEDPQEQEGPLPAMLNEQGI